MLPVVTVMAAPFAAYHLLNDNRDIAAAVAYWFISGISGKLTLVERLHLISMGVRFFTCPRRWLKKLAEATMVITSVPLFRTRNCR